MMLVNASRVRNVPGRKTDVSDAAWLADRGARPGDRIVGAAAGDPGAAGI